MKNNKRIIHLLVLISTLFLALLSYLLYFNLFVADKISSNPYNMRQWDDEKSVVRGNIYDSNGLLLAETVRTESGEMKRYYPEKNLYSHVIGYYSKVYGKSLIEREFDNMLLGKGDISLNIGDIKRGFDVNLTINNSVQKSAYRAMNSRRGAAVAMNPKTGEILAMVSLPDFNPNAENLEKNWNTIVENEDFPLVNRVSSGLYPPGSTFKIVTSVAAFENNLTGNTFEDTGGFSLDGLNVKNYNNESFGNIDFGEAFIHSSNQVFCEIGTTLGGDILFDVAKRFKIGENIDFDVQTESSRLGYKKMTKKDSALFSIGQGKLLVSPLNMLLVCSAIASDGNMYSPYIVKSVTKENGTVIYRAQRRLLSNVCSKSCAEYIKQLMVSTVKSGTGRAAAIGGITVAGKTGTAENEKEKDHSWFVGFAPAENPQIVVAVILENDGGSGGKTAAPVARAIIQSYLGQ